MAEEQTIELDCAIGTPRPGDLIAGVIKGTGLPKREPVLKLLGEWTWDYSDIAEKKWKKISPTLGVRITSLYRSGVIRYGGW